MERGLGRVSRAASVLLAGLSFARFAEGGGSPPVVEERRLANGLRVVLAPDDTLSDVSLIVRYEAEQGDDPDGKEGLAHVTEHVLFGAFRRGAHAKLLLQAGASNVNAHTSLDFTSFEETLPPEALDLALWLEGARMATAADALDESAVVRERTVVGHEYLQYGYFHRRICGRHRAQSRGLPGGLAARGAGCHGGVSQSAHGSGPRPRQEALVRRSACEPRDVDGARFAPCGSPRPGVVRDRRLRWRRPGERRGFDAAFSRTRAAHDDGRPPGHASPLWRVGGAAASRPDGPMTSRALSFALVALAGCASAHRLVAPLAYAQRGAPGVRFDDAFGAPPGVPPAPEPTCIEWRKFTLSNGIPLFVAERHALPSAVVRIILATDAMASGDFAEGSAKRLDLLASTYLRPGDADGDVSAQCTIASCWMAERVNAAEAGATLGRLASWLTGPRVDDKFGEG